MGIETILNKSIYCTENHIVNISFDELEKAFWINDKQLDELDPNDPLYCEIRHNNDEILEQIHELNRG